MRITLNDLKLDKDKRLKLLCLGEGLLVMGILTSISIWFSSVWVWLFLTLIFGTCYSAVKYQKESIIHRLTKR